MTVFVNMFRRPLNYKILTKSFCLLVLFLIFVTPGCTRGDINLKNTFLNEKRLKHWKLVFSDGENILTFDMDGHISKLLYRSNTSFYHPSLSKDKKKILCVAEIIKRGKVEHNIVLYNIATNNLTFIIKNIEAYHPKWSPNELEFAYVSKDKLDNRYNLILYDFRKKKERLLLKRQFFYENANSFDWSPDGKKIVYSSNRWVKILDLLSLHSKKIVKGDAPSWSSKGLISFREGTFNYVVKSDGNTEARWIGKKYFIYDYYSKKVSFLLNGSMWFSIFGCNSGYKGPLIWSPNSKYILFYQYGRFLGDISDSYVVYVMSIKDRKVVKIGCISCPIWGFSWR